MKHSYAKSKFLQPALVKFFLQKHKSRHGDKNCNSINRDKLNYAYVNEWMNVNDQLNYELLIFNKLSFIYNVREVF